MLTLALHHDESVFVYLSETQKGKKSIEQLGLFSPDFSFNRSFLYQHNAKDLLSEMLEGILNEIKKNNQDIFFSFPADLAYISLYDDILKENVKSIVDKDVWLTELKFGHELIEQSDCQVKVVYKENGLSLLTSIYYPKKILELFRSICEENHCRLIGMGINIFNATEVAKKASNDTEYIVIDIKKNEYEIVSVYNDNVLGYARFSNINDHLLYVARNGVIPEGLCEAVVLKNAAELDKYRIFLTGDSKYIQDMEDLVEIQPDIVILNPMNINTSYMKPTVAYDKHYDTVFSSALGALI
ncbi:MAG: hypothetical protein K9N05_05260 [Candidatus Marinimicrobia bacterium]|nr:hypothetical protein [Candidatus Neomarinimicrobiota bacterium]